jgi:hypothetical protein
MIFNALGTLCPGLVSRDIGSHKYSHANKMSSFYTAGVQQLFIFVCVCAVSAARPCIAGRIIVFWHGIGALNFQAHLHQNRRAQKRPGFLLFIKLLLPLSYIYIHARISFECVLWPQVLRDRFHQTSSDRGLETQSGHHTGGFQDRRLQARMPVHLCLGNSRPTALRGRVHQ